MLVLSDLMSRQKQFWIGILEKKKRKKIVRTVHDIYDEDGNIVGEKLLIYS